MNVTGRRAYCERRRVGALLAVLGSIAACGRSASLPPVSAVSGRPGEFSASLAEVGLDEAATVEAGRGALAAAGFTLDEGARRGYHAIVEVVAFGVTAGRGGGEREAEVVLELRLEPSASTAGAARRSGRATVALLGKPGRSAWRDALRAAAKDAAEALALDLRAARRSTDALVSDLAAGDPRSRERAVRALAARGARQTAVAVAGRVRDPDVEVARAAVDALASFKDPATVRMLIDAAQAGDAATTLRLLPVLVEIGGADVEGYLLTLESGHADRDVRRSAAEGLTRLRGGGSAQRGRKR